MGGAEKPNLVDIAAKVADGEKVEWDRLAAEHPEMAAALRNLRLLGAFSDVCRSGTVEGSSLDGSSLDGSSSDSPVESSSEALLPDSLEVPSSGRRSAAEDNDEPDGHEGRLSGTVWGPLRILEAVGEGSFGQVFRAYDSLLQRDVALKLRRPLREGELTAYRRHLDEARRMARVHHPNVLSIHGIETHDDRPGMWMEFVDGQSFEQILESDGPLPVAELVRVSVSLSRALHAVHSAGIVHGDLKVANVMRRNDGSPVLMDFGAGRELQAEVGAAAVPVLEGTPVVMAPEVLLGGLATIRSDLYSLGVVLYRLATSTHPIEAANLPELIEKSQHGVQVPVEEARPGLPPAWARVVNVLLSRDPSERPENAAVVETELALSLEDDAEYRGAFAGRGTDAAKVHGLGSPRSKLIGRRSELENLVRGLGKGKVLVLTGPGGVGKTRVAQEVAFRTAAHYRDGAYWIDLSAVANEEGVWLALGRSLELRESSSQSVREVLTQHLAERNVLIVLDNAEHVEAPLRAVLDSLVPSAPECCWLVTSRSPLRSKDETVLSLTPLAFPTGDTGAGLVREALAFDSVRLFVDRVHSQFPGFLLGPENASLAMDICRRVEGIPFAVELAAARVPTLGLGEVARRLRQDLKVIMGRGSRPTESPHETLRQSIAWSYELLEPEEQALLRGLSVFRGGCTLDAAEQVLGDEVDVVEAISRLVESSLVDFEPGDPSSSTQARYRLLETTRTFSADELERAGQQGDRRAAHLRCYADLAESADAHFQGPEQQVWFERVRAEHDNFDHALRYSTGDDGMSGRAPEAPSSSGNDDSLRLVAHLGRYWDRQGLYHYGIRWTEAVVSGRPADEVTLERAAAFNWLGTLRFIVGRYSESIAAHEESLRVSRAMGRNAGIVSSSINMGNVYYRTGDLDRAREFLEQATKLAEQEKDSVRLATALNSLGAIEARSRRFESALEHYERGLVLQRELKDVYGVSLLTHNIAECLLRSGRPVEAMPYAREALALRRDVGHRPGIASALALLGLISAQQKDYPAAIEYAGESMNLRLEAGLSHGVIQLLELCADVAQETGNAEKTTVLYGAAHRFREESDSRLVGVESEELAAELAELKRKLGPESFSIAWERGRLLSLEEAASLAVDVPGKAAPQDVPDSLDPNSQRTDG